MQVGGWGKKTGWRIIAELVLFTTNSLLGMYIYINIYDIYRLDNSTVDILQHQSETVLKQKVAKKTWENEQNPHLISIKNNSSHLSLLSNEAPHDGKKKIDQGRFNNSWLATNNTASITQITHVHAVSIYLHS